MELLKTGKEKNYLGIVSFVFGICSILSFLLTFLVTGFLLPTFFFGLFAIILGGITKRRTIFPFLGILFGIFSLVLLSILIFLGTFLFKKSIKGTWNLTRASDGAISSFEIKKSGEECYWRYESDYYMGTCEYAVHSNTEESVKDPTKDTYVLYMDLDKIKYGDIVYPASEFLKMEHPYFLLYIYASEDYNHATFYNPTSDTTYEATKIAD